MPLIGANYAPDEGILVLHVTNGRVEGKLPPDELQRVHIVEGYAHVKLEQEGRKVWADMAGTGAPEGDEVVVYYRKKANVI